MEDFLYNLISGVNGGFSYAIVFTILIVCGLGVPLPEDVSLILGGFLVHEQKAQLLFMMITGYAGIIVGDSIIFGMGRRFGSKVGTQPGFFQRIISPAKRARVERLFKRHGEKIIMLARFLPGVRSVTYFTAGSVGMKYSHFIFFDSIAALASAPIFVFLGYKFGGELEYLLQQVRKGQRGVLLAIVVIGVLGFLFSRWRAKRERAANEAALREKQAEETLAPQGAPASDRAGS